MLLKVRVLSPAVRRVVRFVFVAWSTYFLPYSIRTADSAPGGRSSVDSIRLWQPEQPGKGSWLRRSNTVRVDRLGAPSFKRSLELDCTGRRGISRRSSTPAAQSVRRSERRARRSWEWGSSEDWGPGCRAARAK